jgi:hypothetical protein
MSQEYDGTSKPDHAEEVFWLVFRANDHAAKVVKLGEQALDLPATPVATQHLTGPSFCTKVNERVYITTSSDNGATGGS